MSADYAQALLSSAVAASGLSLVAFAGVLGVDGRTLRRWLSGEVKIPASRRRWLERLVRVEVTSSSVTVRLRASRPG